MLQGWRGEEEAGSHRDRTSALCSGVPEGTVVPRPGPQPQQRGCELPPLAICRAAFARRTSPWYACPLQCTRPYQAHCSDRACMWLQFTVDRIEAQSFAAFSQIQVGDKLRMVSSPAVANSPLEAAISHQDRVRIPGRPPACNICPAPWMAPTPPPVVCMA